MYFSYFSFFTRGEQLRLIETIILDQKNNGLSWLSSLIPKQQEIVAKDKTEQGSFRSTPRK